MFRLQRHRDNPWPSLLLSPPRRFLAHAIDKVRTLGAAPLEEQPTPLSLDSHSLALIRSNPPQDRGSLLQLLQQYDSTASTVLDTTLAYEPSPQLHRRIDFELDDTGVVLLSHVLDLDQVHKVTFCSGFAIHVHGHHGSSVIVSCAHTLEEMQRSKVMMAHAQRPDLASTSRSASLVFYQQVRRSALTTKPVTEVLASLPRSDLVLLAARVPSLSTLPVSPYPAPVGTRVRAHFVSESKPTDPDWRPWIHGTWRKWVRGIVVGYRDYAGREAEPGTYDTLSHLLFDPPPLSGSSGGPIVSEESGSVVGIVLGSRMYNRVEGMRGWGVPSEVIYEMFKLPGLERSYGA